MAQSSQELMVSARMARRLPALAARLGVDPQALCSRHQIIPAALDDPTARVPLSSVADGLEDLLASTQHPSLGLELSRQVEPGTYHTPALILLASETLREGLARAFEYQRLWGDGQRFALVEPASLDSASLDRAAHPREPAGAEAGLAVTFRIPGKRRVGYGILEVCALAEAMMAARGLTGRGDEAALALGLPSTSDDVAELARFFGVTPELDTKCAFVVISNATADAPLPHAHALFRAVFEGQAREELARLPPEDDLNATVCAQIRRGLARGRFGLDDSAKALGMSTRTLERRLAQSGSSYQELLEAVRREHARQLLEGGLGVEEVALLLGYTERSSFHRAFVRWFKTTPIAFRRRG